MQAFYNNLWQAGMGRHDALRAAQLAMLERNRREHGDALPSTWGAPASGARRYETHGDGLPSTWGAFVLAGDWR